MKHYLILLIIAGSILLINVGCGGNKGEGKNEKNQSSASSGAGELTYKKFCASCHQSDGNGVPGMYPPISDTKMVNGDKEELIKIILNGMSGEIEVKGEIYNNVMPAHSHLSNKQIADLLTYIRSNFGNNADAILEEEVAALR